MIKNEDNEKRQYNNNISLFLAEAHAITNEEQNAALSIGNNKSGAAFKRLDMADAMLNLASNYLVMNNVSLSMLKQKNESALNEARKAIYKSVIYLEGAVGNAIDAPFSDYQNKLSAIESVSSEQRYLLVRKMGLTVELLKNAYGDNSKWKWSFVELEGRYAAVAKNILDLRYIIANSDPRSPNYEPTVNHLRLVRKLFTQCADRYREKYELSTNRFDDFKKGITFLSALNRLDTLSGFQHDTTTVKKKLEIWTNKLTADMKKYVNQANNKNQ